MLEGKILKVRWVKAYPSAHNHVAVGEVLDGNDTFLSMLCKTYHIGHTGGGRRATLRPGEYVSGILEGEKCIRIIPWQRIEVANELPPATEWDVDARVESSGLCTLLNEHRTVITRPPERET